MSHMLHVGSETGSKIRYECESYTFEGSFLVMRNVTKFPSLAEPTSMYAPGAVPMVAISSLRMVAVTEE